MTEKINSIIKDIRIDNETETARALEAAARQTGLSDAEKTELAAGLSALFYHDLHGKKGLIQIASQAEDVIASLGTAVLPYLIGEVAQADAESAAHFGRVIARGKAAAVKPMLEAINAHRGDDYAMMNLIAAISFFKDPAALEAIPEILVASKGKNERLRAEALYAVGRLVRNLGSDRFDDTLRLKMFDTCFEALKDKSPLVRRNATASLGKIAEKGMLTGNQEQKVLDKFKGLIGIDGAHNWDNAYIVRQQAQQFFKFLKEDGNIKNRYHQTFRIMEKRELCPDTYYYSIDAPLIARKLVAGQFIIIRANEHGERIPLSIAGWDVEKGTINVIIMSAGRSSREINMMNVGDRLADVVGPLGQHSHVQKHDGVCVVIGGGYGTGAVLPTARALKKAGNKVYGIVGARNEKLLIMEDELKQVCDEVLVTTNDGTKGIQGFVTHAMEAIMKRGEKISHVLAIGPVPMMMAVANMTKPLGIETFVSLNAIMVDGTGMCGACRVSVGGKTRFACFHGPDFNGHEVDFDQLMKRQKMFVAKEKLALEAMGK